MHTLSTKHFSWSTIVEKLGTWLMQAPHVYVGEWQSIRGDHAMATTHELPFVSLEMLMPHDRLELAALVKPNLPWAEDHFQERVSGEPLNPPPSHEWWPFAQKDNAEHRPDGEKFSHTYPERMWPKYAEVEEHPDDEFGKAVPNAGIRFEYGDLQDVVNLLSGNLATRQAYLPIWFPEDTGATASQRVPCTLGYHFLVRENEVNIVYYIRSCDFLRHFADDVYMAARLAQWVGDQLGLDAGYLVMHISSLHIFEGDMPIMEVRYGKKTKS